MKLFRKVFASESLLLFEKKRQRLGKETHIAKRNQAAREEFSGIPEGRFPFLKDFKGDFFEKSLTKAVGNPPLS